VIETQSMHPDKTDRSLSFSDQINNIRNFDSQGFARRSERKAIEGRTRTDQDKQCRKQKLSHTIMANTLFPAAALFTIQLESSSFL
jgi:hypothetical protein